jgi:hypothetical protein
MNDTQIKSLEFITKYLGNVDFQEFLNDYEECEEGIGPTVQEYMQYLNGELPETCGNEMHCGLDQFCQRCIVLSP